MDNFNQLTSKDNKKKIDFIKNYLKKIFQKIKPKKISLLKKNDKIGIKDISEDNKSQISMKKAFIFSYYSNKLVNLEK